MWQFKFKLRKNIHWYIHRAAYVWYPHMDKSMDISMDIHIHGNPVNYASKNVQDTFNNSILCGEHICQRKILQAIEQPPKIIWLE